MANWFWRTEIYNPEYGGDLTKGIHHVLEILLKKGQKKPIQRQPIKIKPKSFPQNLPWSIIFLIF